MANANTSNLNEKEISYETPSGEKVRLTINLVRSSLVSGGKQPTDGEVIKFMKLCEAKKLNPFANEVWLVKYDDGKPANISVSKDGFISIASRNQRFEGFRNGIVVLKKDGTIENRIGSLLIKSIGEQLVGGWADVFVKGYREPISETVSLDEYDSKRQMWQGKKGTMIQKVALSHALRSAFPSDLNGFYDETELSEDKNDEVKSSSVKREMKTKAKETVRETIVPEPDKSNAGVAGNPEAIPEEPKPKAMTLEEALNHQIETSAAKGYTFGFLMEQNEYPFWKDKTGKPYPVALHVKETYLNKYANNSTGADRDAAAAILDAIKAGSYSIPVPNMAANNPAMQANA